MRFAFAESLALASTLGTDAESKMLKFIEKQARSVAQRLGISHEQLMPKKDQSGSYTVPPVPTDVDQLKLKAEVSA